VKIDFSGIYTSVKELNEIPFANLLIDIGAAVQRQQLPVLELRTPACQNRRLLHAAGERTVRTSGCPFANEHGTVISDGGYIIYSKPLIVTCEK
jgi:hypothetical protein